MDCPYCGKEITTTAGCSNFQCPSRVYGLQIPKETKVTYSMNPGVGERIATALERIAAALESTVRAEGRGEEKQ
jgi:Ni,Fe-hydrogenase maturation factor